MEKEISSPELHSDILTLLETAALLGVSDDTVRNWVKLGRLCAISDAPLLFSKNQVHVFLKELPSSDLLKRRRNKSRIDGSVFPRTYIDSRSPNFSLIKEIVASAKTGDLSDEEVIFSYAKKLLADAGVPSDIVGLLTEGVSCEDDINDLYPLEFIPGEDTLGMLYLTLRRLNEKKATGSYYTPFFVVDWLITSLYTNNKLHGKTILDPSCGTGNFLLRLPDDIPLEDIYGFDIDNTAIKLARINLALKYRIKDNDSFDTICRNVRTANFLFDKNSPLVFSPLGSYDVILGNPPWGFSFDRADTALLRSHYASAAEGRTPESFSLFVERALDSLNAFGTLSFVLPETLLGADLHMTIRKLILERSCVNSLIYLGEVFDKVQCPSIILTLSDRNSDTDVSFMSLNRNENRLLVQKEFSCSEKRLSKDSFHLLSDDNEYKILEKICSCPHFTLKGNADFALGIVTGSNKTALQEIPGDGLEPIIRGRDISKYHIDDATSFVKFDRKSFQQCAPEEIFRADEKLFYRFISDEPVFAMDTTHLLSLNSANIVIPHVPGYSCAYILSVLNSSVISFYYKKSFKNLKVLRSALEQLPIAACSSDNQKKAEGMALRLSCLDPQGDEFKTLSADLDLFIAGLYGITEAEYKQFTFSV